MTANEVSDQMKFVRKVYAILACQLSLTAGFILIVQTSDSTRKFCQTNIALNWVMFSVSIISMYALVYCFSRKVPHNYILLFLFTASETYMIGGLTAFYDQQVVIMAGLCTALVTISLTIYAMRTKVKIEVFMAMAFVVYLAMLPIIIIGWAIGMRALWVLYNVLGLIFYSLYLIIDTSLITGNMKSSGGVAISLDDYILGAMILYIDIIMIFLYLLRIFGSR